MSRAGAVPSAGAADVPLLSPSITVDRIRRIFTPPAPMRLYNLGAIQQQQEQQQQEQQQQEQQEQQERDGAQPASVTPVHSERFAEMRLKFECGAGRGATTSAPPAPLPRRGSSRSCAGTPASSPSPPASSPSSPLSLTTLAIKVGCQALATAGQDVVPGADSAGAGPDAAHRRDDAGVRAVAARYPADPAPRALPRKRGGPSDGGARRQATSIPRANGVVSASGAGDPRTTPIAARGLPARSRLNSGPISKRLSGFMQDDSSSDGDDGDADEAQGGRADEPARDPAAAAAGHRDDAATGPPGAAGRGRPRSAGAEEGQVLGNSSSSTAMSSPDGSPVSKLGSIAECDLGASDCVGSPVFTEHGERSPSHHQHDRGGEERAATVEDRAAPGASADHGQRRTKEGVPVGVEARGSREREGREAALPQPHAEARGATPTTAGDLRHETPLHQATGAMPGEPPVTTTPAKAVTLAVTPAMTPAVTVTPTLTKTTTLIATSALNTNLTTSAAPAKTVPLLTTPVMTKSVTVIPITTLTMNSAISATAIITSTSPLTVGDVTQSTTVTPAGPAQASPVSQGVSTEHNHRYRGSGEAGRDDGCPRDATEETGVDGAGEEEEEPRFGGPSGTQCLEIPGLGEEPGEALMPGRRVHFSHKPIKVFATFSTERYERRKRGRGPRARVSRDGAGDANGGAGRAADCAAEGICEMDQILAVDSTSLVGASQEVATRVLQSTGETVRLVIGREKGAHVVGSEGNSELSVKYKELLIRFAAVTNEVKALKKEVCEAEAAQAKGERQRYLLQTKLKEERRRGEAMETVMATKAEEAERRHRELLRRYRRAVALLAPALIRRVRSVWR
ncbi:neurabin-2-like [Lethenteron reissneri]|uniref:neurabin-2-like n=1 Tax=Lethenteron reissneri TaxID=7753 RepID=UPI002AB5DE67|nr:neurabin-2-like [Lethenteron reissneri]XP_061429609.1 neurabin-2-like [Lethenteron reissneri]